MTNEEAKDKLDFLKTPLDEVYKSMIEALDMAIKALEQEAEAVQFVKWVAREIFDDMWGYNKDSFAEIACRKLAKLGVVKVEGDEWKLVESQESEVQEIL